MIRRSKSENPEALDESKKDFEMLSGQTKHLSNELIRWLYSAAPDDELRENVLILMWEPNSTEEAIEWLGLLSEGGLVGALAASGISRASMRDHTYMKDPHLRERVIHYAIKGEARIATSLSGALSTLPQSEALRQLQALLARAKQTSDPKLYSSRIKEYLKELANEP